MGFWFVCLFLFMFFRDQERVITDATERIEKNKKNLNHFFFNYVKGKSLWKIEMSLGQENNCDIIGILLMLNTQGSISFPFTSFYQVIY